MSVLNTSYETQDTPFLLKYQKGQEEKAKHITSIITRATAELESFLGTPFPAFQVVLVPNDSWEETLPEAIDGDPEEVEAIAPQPFFTQATVPPMLVLPEEIDPIWGEITDNKFAFLLYHELAVHALESDFRPWPEDIPLWADEWQFKFLALLLSHRLDGVTDIVSEDLFKQYPEILVAEADGKTPITVRGFDWYEEDTDPEEYLEFKLLLERFAADLLATYGTDFFQRFLTSYRVDADQLLSENVVTILAQALDPEDPSQANDWLEERIYF